MCQGTALMVWGHQPLDEAVFEFNMARGHFLMDLLMAMSTEYTPVAQKSSFPLPSSPTRCNDTALFSLVGNTATVSGDSC